MSEQIVFDAALKAKWVAALRSGEFKQCRYMLQNERGENCCLGVFAKVSDLNFSYTQIASVLGYGPTNELMVVNDGRCGKNGKSFPEIADYIEQNIPASSDSSITSHSPAE